MSSVMNLLGELSNAHGISGHEQEIRNIVSREWKDVSGEWSHDFTGSICKTFGNRVGPKVMLTAHMDEIGFLVQDITSNGFLKIVPVGGWWNHTLPSQRLILKTYEGEKILGVIGTKPPHFLPESQRNQVLSIENMFVDVGARSSKEVEDWGIRLGDPLAPATKFEVLGKSGKVSGKAFDNRLGVTALIRATQELSGEPLPNQLQACATVQEEVGLRGARTAANLCLPDVAIILEGPPADDTPGFFEAGQGVLGQGVQLRLFDPTAIINPHLAHLAIETAKSLGIPHQVTVRRSGGTDAGQIHLAQLGVPSIVLGCPARYIHSHNAVAELSDLEAMISLAKSLVRQLDAQTVSKLTRFL